MKKTFKKLITSLMFLVLVFFFAGCGGGGGGGSSGGSGGGGGGDTPSSRTISRYAIFVGINDYPGTASDLDYCVNDATDMKASLNGSNEWSGATFVTLTNSNATKSNIQAYINSAANDITATGTFLFFYSGHGSHSGSIGYIINYDGLTEDGYAVANWCISSNNLESWLSNFPSSTKKIVILDSCYSGNFIGKELPPNTKIKFVPMEGSDTPYDKNFIKDITTASNLFGMTAAAGDELSAESAVLQNGIFVYYIVQGLGAGATIGPADADVSGIITCLEAFNYANPLATAFRATQHAQYYNGGNSTIKR